MANLAEQLSNYATSLHYRNIPADVVHLAKRMIIDTLGCALGGYSSEPSKIVRDLAGTVTSTSCSSSGASVTHVLSPRTCRPA